MGDNRPEGTWTVREAAAFLKMSYEYTGRLARRGAFGAWHREPQCGYVPIKGVKAWRRKQRERLDAASKRATA